MTLLFAVCVISKDPIVLGVAAITAIISLLTDFFDGYLARKRGLVSAFGICGDPIADKIFVLGAFISLAARQELALSHIATVVLVIREFSITGLRVVLLVSGARLLPSEKFGKMKTAIQFFLILLFTGTLALLYAGWQVTVFLRAAPILYWLMTIVAVASGMSYLWGQRRGLVESWMQGRRPS